MEKYGVDEQEDGKDAAMEPTHCPVCGRALEPQDGVNVLKCPVCGTAPFEGNDESAD